MLAQLKRWIKKMRKTNRYAYDIPAPIGSVANAVSSWNYNMTNSLSVAVAYDSPPGMLKTEDTRVVKKPVDVVNDIIAETPAMDVNDLDIQIKVVQRRFDIMQEIGGNIRDEFLALAFLKARKKWKKVSHLFSRWAVTNQPLIEKLCSQYKVACVDFGGYSRNVPQEGLDQLELYFEAWNKVIPDQKPMLKLIVDSGGPEMKKDPILLAQSPFGAWWYILGAWDKEVEIVDDLVYHNK